jgi:hypothetical protein
MSAENYNLASILLQIVIAIVAFATVWVYYFQLRAMQNSAVGNNILALVNFLQQPHVREARTTVLTVLRTKPYAEWTSEERRAAGLVCSTYDIAGILILDLKMVPSAPFLSNWGPSIRNCFEIVRPFHAEMRSIAHSGPEYWKVFGRLAEQSNTL